MLNKSRIAEIAKYTVLMSVVLYVMFPVASRIFPKESEVSDSTFLIDPEKTLYKKRPTIAFNLCNTLVEAEIGETARTEFLADTYKVWSLSSGKYLVQSDYIQHSETGESHRNQYACRLQFVGGKETDQSNWAFEGLDTGITVTRY